MGSPHTGKSEPYLAKGTRLERLQVVLEAIQAPDAHERLRRAFDLILREAARAEEQAGGSTPSDAEHGDAGGRLLA